ncbi:MAG: endo-1,4-beta-xylanase [Sphingomonas sp.]
MSADLPELRGFRPTRRAVLAAALATPVAAAARQRAANGLNAIAARRGLRFGSAVSWSAPGADRGSFANPAYARLLERDCGILVAENEMKWQALRPSPTVFRFERADAIVDYAGRHDMAMRGHNLFWNQPKWLPTWLNDHDFGSTPRAEAARLLTDHIRTVCTRYGRRIASYDVVNETVRPEDGTLYDTSIARAYGGTAPLLDLAYHTARDAAPHAELVYNDFMGWEPDSATHRAGVLRLLEGFRKRGTPIDALGLQSHLVTQGEGASLLAMQREWQRFLDEVTGMGYRLLITEFDVRDDGLPRDATRRDHAVADYARSYLDATLSYRQLHDLLAWGMTDRFSWLDGFKPRPDGARRRGCPHDERYRPKPLHDAIARARADAPAR